MTELPTKRVNAKVLIVLAGAAMVCALVLVRSPAINGSWYWRWPWRDRARLPAVRYYGAMLLAAGPMIAAWFLPSRTRGQRLFAIALLMISVVALKIVSVTIVTAPMSFALLDATVQSPDATSYYTDAAAINQAMPVGWLESYPEILAQPQINLHTKSKPPGAVAFYMMWIRALGYGPRSAITSGIVIAIISAFSIPAMFWFVTLLSPNRAAALYAACLLALCPGYLLIFPTFDSCYPILTCALIGSWHLALKRDDCRFAAVIGVILSIACFMTYNLLVLGAIMVAWMFIVPKERNGQLKRAIRLAVIVLLTFLIVNVLLWFTTGFDPIATFRTAYHNQQLLLSQHRDERPYPWTILFDLLDFGFGAGWLIVLLVIFGISHRLLRDRGWRDVETRIVLLCIAQPIFVAILGILQSETARAWNFMLPLLILPAAIELARWSRAARIITYFAMLIVLLVIGHNMVFMVP